MLQTKNACVLGFCWVNWNEIVFITDQGIEFYQVDYTSNFSRAAEELDCVHMVKFILYELIASNVLVPVQ